MRKLVRWLVILLVATGLAAAVWALWRGDGDDGGGLTLVEVTAGSITEKAVAVGQVEPRLRFHVKSKIPGIVRRCLVEVGDRVREGDPLFEIAPDPTPLELTEVDWTVEAAQAAYDKARADLERTRQLVGQGILAAADLDSGQAAFDQARVALERARDHQELTRQGRIAGRGAQMESVIRAPAAGTVLSRSVAPGDPVVPLTSYQEGTELAVVADMGDLIFRGTVDEIDVGKLAVGLEARLKVGALPEAEVRGRLSRIAPQARTESNARLFDVEIELAPAAGVLLRAGYSANADLVIREKHDVALLPERLVLFEHDGATTSVEVPAADPAAEPRKVEVELGLSDGLNVEIVSGLAVGDRVVQRPPRPV